MNCENDEESPDEISDAMYKEFYNDYLLECDCSGIEPEDFETWLPKEHMRQYMIRQCAKD